MLPRAKLPATPPAPGIWIDLSDPMPGEVERIEGLIGTAIPSHEDMVEIEKSSRLYAVRDVAMMTVPLLIKSTGEYPEMTHVAFMMPCPA
jgi:magnesium transporter